MKPLVSILIPVYNRGDLVSESIESAINQTYKNLEIIIVDNNSTDNTWEVLQHYDALDSRIRLFRNNENIGPVRNWKRCIDEAKGIYSKILFSDDLISTNFVAESLDKMDADTAFILSSIKVFNDEMQRKVGSFDEKSEFSTKEYFNNILLKDLYRFPVSPGSALFRTKDLKTSLIIDIPNSLSLEFDKYGAGNDLLLFLNTAINYKTIGIAGNAIAWFRSHDGSFSISKKLDVYYNYSKFFFIKNKYPKHLSKYKTYLWLKYKRKKIKNPVYELIEKPLDYNYILILGLKVMMIKFKNYFKFNLL